MKNTCFQYFKKFGFLLKLVLTTIFCLGAFGHASALECSQRESWNGSVSVGVYGNYVVAEMSDYNGTLQFSDIGLYEVKLNLWTIDDPSGVFGQAYDNVLQTSGQQNGTVLILVDAQNKTITVQKEGLSGIVPMDSPEVCYGQPFNFVVLDVDRFGSNIQWGVILNGSTDTTWIAEAAGQDRLSYDITERLPFDLIVKLTSESEVVITKTNVVPSLRKCGGHKVESVRPYVCVGRGADLVTDYTGATEYVWKNSAGTVMATTSEPKAKVMVNKKDEFFCYADGLLVGSVVVDCVECEFFIGSRYPLNTCLQDSNVLLAGGTYVIDALGSKNFVWEKSLDGSNWTEIKGQNSVFLSVPIPQKGEKDSIVYYRASYDGRSEVLIYEAPDCASSEHCDGLETKTLFYETFGYFMSADFYVSNGQFFSNKITVDHSTSVVINNGANSYDVPEAYNIDNPYYSARAVKGDRIVVDHSKTTDFLIRNYIAPDPFGYVVTATEFTSNSGNETEANQFVGTNGHHFLTANPMLAQYELDTWARNGGQRLQDGYYAIVVSPDSCDQNLNGNDFIDCGDYTGNKNGAMLFVNAGKTELSKAAIYAQKVALSCPADRFNFGLSVRNACAPRTDAEVNPVNLTICLLKDLTEASKTMPNDLDNDDNVLYHISTGDVKAGDGWLRLDRYVELEEGYESLWVVIYNNGKSGDGNDMLLDDISFSVCMPKSKLEAIVDGEIVSKDIVTCSGEDIVLKASQTNVYLLNPYYIFQYEHIEGKDTVWKDIASYDVKNPETMKPDSVIVSTKKPEFVGDVRYRVVISDDTHVARMIADGTPDLIGGSDKDIDCKMTFHQAMTDMVIRNTYGGEMAARDSVAYCNIADTKVVLIGNRLLTNMNHTWTLSWLLADSTELFSKEVTGVSMDSLVLTVLEGDQFNIVGSDGVNYGNFPMSQLDSVIFKAEDEGGCVFYQNIVTHAKYNLNMTIGEENFVDCNSITVKVNRNYPEVPLVFDWSSVDGDVAVVNDTTQTFVPAQLLNYSEISGFVKVTPINVEDEYCFLQQDGLSIPYTVQNGQYKVKVKGDRDPVCVSAEMDNYDANVLTLTAFVDTENMSAEEAKKVENKIKSYDWLIVFNDGSVMDTTTTGPNLAFTNRDLLSDDLMQIKTNGLQAYIKATTSEICESVTQDTSDMGVNIEVREGGFAMKLSADPTVCLNSEKEHALRVVITPSTAVQNLTSVTLSFAGKTMELTELDDTFNVSITKAAYPEVFTAGNTVSYKLSVYDETCKNNNESAEVPVKYNGYNWTFNKPDSCMTQGDKFNIVASIDYQNATKHINSYVWTLNGDVIPGATGLTYSHRVDSSMTGTFVLTTSDGICPPVSDTFTTNISVKYDVEIECATNVICSTGEAVVKSVISPESSRRFIKEYKWILVDSTGKEEVLENTNIGTDLVLNTEKHPDLFKPGNSFSIYLLTSDGICTDARSEGSLSFDVNVPFTLSLTSSETNDCYREGDPAYLDVAVSPKEAINHIDKFVWTRVGNGKEMTHTTTGTHLDLTTVDGWMTPDDNIVFKVSAEDGICMTSANGNIANSSTSMNINTPYTVTLSADKVMACSVKDSMRLTATNSGISNKDKDFTYTYTSTLNGTVKSFDRTSASNPLTLIDVMESYAGLEPGSVITYSLTVDDGGVCGPVTVEQPVSITIQTPYSVNLKIEDNLICKGEDVAVSVAKYTPASAAQFVQKYTWYQVESGRVGKENSSYRSLMTTSGTFHYFAQFVDGVCYGGVMPPLNSDTVEIKVNEPISVTLASSASVFCESDQSEPLVFTATCSKGEPSRYELYVVKNGGEGVMVGGSDSKEMSHSWLISPSSEGYQYKVLVYDGNVCPYATDERGPTAIQVFKPVQFAISIPDDEYKICLGDTVHLTTTVSQGTPMTFKWEGLAIGEHKTNNLSLLDIPLESGYVDYKVTASDGVCPDVEVDFGTVEVFEPPVVKLELSQAEVVIGGDVDMTATIEKGSPTQFDWLGDNVLLTSTDVNYLNGVYPASSTKYTVFASDGICPATFASFEITVQIPTAFTPYLKDGMNDYYMKGFDVQIFDRYGMKVHQGSDGWDGTKGGRMADPGVYFSQVVLKDGKLHTGTIEVVNAE